MKHQAITLLKFKSLSARLSLPLWQTVGLLEGIWLFAMHNARDGDLSRFRPAELAAWLEYDGDAVVMIEALVETKWLDRKGDELVIHDWADHKPTWLKGVEARQLSNEPSSELSSEPSPSLSGAKSGTKQVRVRVRVNNAKSNSKGARARKFRKPTLEEVRDYCRDRDNGIDAQEFIDHHDAVGWVVGKNRSPMRDWRATIRRWEANRRKDQPASRVATADDLQHFDLMNGQPR
jgi:hypothetical protein